MATPSVSLDYQVLYNWPKLVPNFLDILFSGFKISKYTCIFFSVLLCRGKYTLDAYIAWDLPELWEMAMLLFSEMPGSQPCPVDSCLWYCIWIASICSKQVGLDARWIYFCMLCVSTGAKNFRLNPRTNSTWDSACAALRHHRRPYRSFAVRLGSQRGCEVASECGATAEEINCIGALFSGACSSAVRILSTSAAQAPRALDPDFVCLGGDGTR